MSLTYKPTITSGGISHAIAVNNDGVDFRITHVSFGGTKFNPTGKEKEIIDERLKKELSSTARVNDNTFKIRCRARSQTPFYCQSIGFWSDDVLFAVYSSTDLSPTGLFNIHNSTDTVISYSLALAQLGADSYEVILNADEDHLLEIIALHEDDENAHGVRDLKDLVNTKIGNEKKSNAIDSTSQDTVATSYAVNKLNQAIKQGLANRYTKNESNARFLLANLRSDSVTSSSSVNIATSLAVKTVNDKANQLEQNKLDKSALSSSVTSADETKASTPKAVKTAYDKAVQADNNANGRLSKNGGTLRGDLFAKKSVFFQREGLRASAKFQLLADERLHLYQSGGTASNSSIYFPRKSGTLVLDSDVDERVKKSGDTMNGDLRFTKNTTGVEFPLGNGGKSGFNTFAVRGDDCIVRFYSRKTNDGYSDCDVTLPRKSGIICLRDEGVPVGAFFPLSGEKLPAGYLWMDNGYYDPKVYPDLFKVLGYYYGRKGDKFLVPSIENRFIRGMANGLKLGQKQEDAIQYHGHIVSRGNQKLTRASGGGGANFTTPNIGFSEGNQNSNYYIASDYTENGKINTVFTGRRSDETRPKSIAFPYIIKY